MYEGGTSMYIDEHGWYKGGTSMYISGTSWYIDVRGWYISGTSVVAGKTKGLGQADLLDCAILGKRSQ